MLPLKIEINPKTAFATPLMSDTLWGQFCCSLAEIEGTEKLESMLGENEHSSFLAFSDAFPSGKLPVPIVEPSFLPEEKIEYEEQKRINKLEFMDSERLMGIRANLSFAEIITAISDEFKKDRQGTAFIQRSRVRTAINRNSGGSLKGALYEVDETWYSEGISLDIYCFLDTETITEAEFENIVEYIGSTGFGKDSNVGLGRFDIINITENPDELENIGDEDQNLFMTLSHGFPSDGSEVYYGKTMTKFGKHGGKWATSGRYLKNPVILFEPGSTFKINKNKEVYGRVFTEVSENPGPHQHSAWMVPFYMRVKEG